MKPISFHEKEINFMSPDPNISSLPVLQIAYDDGQRGLVSCWKPSFREILQIIFGQPIFLMILGEIQPPVALLANRKEALGPNQ